MKVLACGDRNWTDKGLIKSTLESIPDLELVIEGGARGADTLAREAAVELGIEVREYGADWERFGRAAGPIRNRRMLDEKPDLVIAFHDNISKSKGTADTLREAKRRGIGCRLIDHSGCVTQEGGRDGEH